jgi:molybdate transport system ATP-binding protein
MIYVSHQFEEVLRLATHVVLLDAGKVVAQGSPGEVSLRPELRAIVGPEAVGAVLDGIVSSVDETRNIADVQLGRSTLRISARNARVGSSVRVRLLARDIILATEQPHALSVRNAIEGVIDEVSDDDGEAKLVRVDIGGAFVLSRVTVAAVEALRLQRGQAVWVLIKAVSMRGHTFTGPARSPAS